MFIHFWRDVNAVAEPYCGRWLGTRDTPPAQFCPDNSVFVADLRRYIKNIMNSAGFPEESWRTGAEPEYTEGCSTIRSSNHS